MLLSELVDIRRFSNFDRLASFVGLVPSTHSSGQSQRTTGITPRSSYQLRALLIESSWVAIRFDPELREKFEKTSTRMPKNRAIIVVAHTLLSRLHHVLVHNEPYRINNSLEKSSPQNPSENSSEAHG